MNLLAEIDDLQASTKILAERIQRIDELREELESPGGLDYSKDPVKTSPQDQLAKNIAELVDKQTQLAKDALEHQERIDRLMEKLEMLPPEDREIIFYRSDGWTYRQIADAIYKSKSTVCRIAKRVLERNV